LKAGLKVFPLVTAGSPAATATTRSSSRVWVRTGPISIIPLLFVPLADSMILLLMKLVRVRLLIVGVVVEIAIRPLLFHLLLSRAILLLKLILVLKPMRR
jgi:hypothetical protein